MNASVRLQPGLMYNPDLGTTVSAARRGSRPAFGRLYERYARMVHGILLARVPHSEVEDLVHDVFVLAMEKLPDLRDESCFGAWLAAIARNCAAERGRRSVRSVEVRDDMLREDAPRPEAYAVLDAIRGLPETYRETLMLRLVEGMTGPEIAEHTGLTPESVRVNLCRGMKLLRERIEGRAAL